MCGRRARARTPVAGGAGTSSANRPGSISSAQARDAFGEIGRQCLGQAGQRGGIAGDDELDHGAEAQRVLEGVEPLDHRQIGIRPRGSEARRRDWAGA